jgi:DNA-binding CsgD family transcriptional regulator
VTPRRGRGRGGRGGHEPRLRLQAREHRAYELSIQGKSQTEIAAELQISQPAVSKLLRRMEDRLAAEMADTLRRLRVRTFAQFGNIYAEAMQAFERSKAPQNQRRQRKILGAGQDESIIAELVTEEGSGDPRHLEVARRALGDLAKLAGLDTIPMTAVANTSDLSELTTDEFEARGRRIVAQLWPDLVPAHDVASPSVEAARPRPLTATEAYAEELARRERERDGG